ncbi:MAG: lipopolysaccharide biosynthesis protein [Methylobacter sp.]
MKGAALNVVARVLVIVFQLVNVKLYTHYLGAEQLGVYFFLLTVSYSANAILFVPMDYYQQAKLANVISASGSARPLLNFNGRLTALYLVFSMLLVAASIVVKPVYTVYAMLVPALAFALYAVQALRNTLNNLEHRNCVSVSFIQEAVFKVLLFYLWAKYFKADESLLIVAWLVALGLSCLYLSYKAYRYRIFTACRAYRVCAKEVFNFSYPFSIGAVCNWLQLQGYRLVLVPLGFAEEVGAFATIANIGSSAIGAASLIYSQQFTPLIYKSSGQYTSKYLKGAIAVIIGVALVSTVLGEFAVRLLTGPDFERHWNLLLFGVLTDGGNLLIGALMIYITLKGNTKKIFTSSLVGLISMSACFGWLYWSANISLLTIGAPLLISQWAVVYYMYSLYRRTARTASR